MPDDKNMDAESSKTRKKNKKKRKNAASGGIFATIVLIVLILVTLITGIVIYGIQRGILNEADSEDQVKEYTRYYAFISDDDDTSFWNEVYEGARVEGDETDVFVEDFASDLAVTYSTEERIRIAVAAGVDGIIVENVGRNSVKNEIAAATEAGIPVVMAGNGDDDAATGRVSFVGVSRYDLGGMYGRQVAVLSKKLLEDRNVVRITVLTGKDSDAESQKLLISAIREILSQDTDLYGKIAFDTYEIDDIGDFASQGSVTDMLMDPANVPDILITLNEDHTNSAYQAVIDNNIVGQCNIIGYYDSEAIRNAIRNQIIYSTVSVDAFQMGRYAADALNEYLDTGYVSEYFTTDAYAIDYDTVISEGGDR